MTLRSVSAGMVRLIGLAAAHMRFAESSGLLRDLAGVRVSARQVERTAEALGAGIAADERERIDLEPSAARTMYLGMDGTGVPMRKSEIEGRAGNQPDGSARTREMKLAVVWTAETMNEDGHRKADAMSTSYNAAIELARMGVWDKQLSAFAQRVEREAHRRGFYEAERQVVIGDGARWIWHLGWMRFFPGRYRLSTFITPGRKSGMLRSQFTGLDGLDRTMGTGAGEAAQSRRF